MPETNWGRKETIIWPPHSPIYTLGAVFLALILTGLFVYLRFAFGLSALEKFYLPLYIKTSIAPSLRSSAKYQMLLMSDGKGHAWYAREADVAAGSTQQANAKPIPLVLSDSARQHGMVYLYRSAPIIYQNSALGSYLKQQVYGRASIFNLFEWPLIFGALALIGQLSLSIPKDIRRRKQMKYGRRLKGPILVTPREFNKAFDGTGIGLKVDRCRKMLRIPQRAEDQHFEIIGDTGSGKTTIILQMLRQIQARGHSAIVHDPACEFIERFYDESRGDIVLNPLDRRCPYWGPSEELVRRAEARTIAASLFQRTTERKDEFFIDSPQKIFAHLLLELPTPQQLVQWMSHPEEIDRRVKGTELALLIEPSAPHQRMGVLGSLSLVADSFRLLPTKAEAKTEWTARSGPRIGRDGSLSLRSPPNAKLSVRYTVFGSIARSPPAQCAKAGPASGVVCDRRVGQPAEAATTAHRHHRESQIPQPARSGFPGQGPVGSHLWALGRGHALAARHQNLPQNDGAQRRRVGEPAPSARWRSSG